MKTFTLGGGIDDSLYKATAMATRGFSMWNRMMANCGSTTIGAISTTSGIVTIVLSSVLAIFFFLPRFIAGGFCLFGRAGWILIVARSSLRAFSRFPQSFLTVQYIFYRLMILFPIIPLKVF